MTAYLETLHVEWDILPPGSVDEVLTRLFRGRVPSAEERDTVKERYEFFTSLNPQKLVYGNSGFQRYFGAMVRPDLVVFENVKYGNAIYIMFGSWGELSKKSRVELLSGRCGNGFERVVHTSSWKERVKSLVGSKV